jgi:hypothetical protein
MWAMVARETATPTRSPSFFSRSGAVSPTRQPQHIILTWSVACV